MYLLYLPSLGVRKVIVQAGNSPRILGRITPRCLERQADDSTSSSGRFRWDNRRSPPVLRTERGLQEVTVSNTAPGRAGAGRGRAGEASDASTRHYGIDDDWPIKNTRGMAEYRRRWTSLNMDLHLPYVVAVVAVPQFSVRLS